MLSLSSDPYFRLNSKSRLSIQKKCIFLPKSSLNSTLVFSRLVIDWTQSFSPNSAREPHLTTSYSIRGRSLWRDLRVAGLHGCSNFTFKFLVSCFTQQSEDNLLCFSLVTFSWLDLQWGLNRNQKGQNGDLVITKRKYFKRQGKTWNCIGCGERVRNRHGDRYKGENSRKLTPALPWRDDLYSNIK